MLFVLNPPFLVLVLTTAMAAVTAVAALRRRSDSSAGGVFVALMLFITAYGAVAALEALVVPLRLKMFWATMEYVASGGTVALFVLFTLRFTGSGRPSPRLLWLIPAPVAHVALTATNSWHHLVWTGFIPGPAGSNQIVYRHGPGFFAIMLSVYIHALIGLVVLALSSQRASPLYRRQAAMAVAGAVFPMLSGAGYMLDLNPPGWNIIPMSFLITGVLFFVSLYHSGMLDLIPVARDSLVDSMGDGMIVLDRRRRIVDTNLAARQILQITDRYVGLRVRAVLPDLPLREPPVAAVYSAPIIDAAGKTRILEFDVTPLGPMGSPPGGCMIILRDVTQRQAVEAGLQQANEILQVQLQEIASLHAQLQEQAIRDVLTGLYNRRYFEETLAREIARAEREVVPLSIILLDLDHFKSVNDTRGHLAGDHALREFANLLTHSSRGGDVACRFGGEEFAIILPGASGDVAVARAEEIRLNAARLIKTPAGEDFDLTVSGGISVFPLDGETGESLIRCADNALYRAKRAGRNRIERGDYSLRERTLPPHS